MTDIMEQWWNQGQTVIENGLLKHYRQLGLDSEELVFVIQLKSFLDQKHCFPSMTEISERMGITEAKVFSILHELIQRKIVAIQTEKDGAGKDSDRYVLVPLYRKLVQIMEQTDAKVTDNDTNLLEIFQQEFGRLLTPIEIQTIGDWLDKDHYKKELILAALKEAVLNQKYSLRYIDRILMSWEKKKISTPGQAQAEAKRFSQYQDRGVTSNEPEPKQHIPLFNWLEPNE